MWLVRFQGGLGNQMFQYVFLRMLVKRYPNQEVAADLLDYDAVRYHQGFELQRIFRGVRLPVACENDVFRLSGRGRWRYGEFACRAYRKIVRILGGKDPFAPDPSKVHIINDHTFVQGGRLLCGWKMRIGKDSGRTSAG